MLRGDWLKRPTFRLVAGLLVAVVFCAGWIGYGLSQSAEYERQARTNTEEDARYTRGKIAQTCLGLPALERAKCVYEAHDAKGEKGYNQADLVAQRQSALWAYIMASAAVIGMGLSVIGVWLVWTTFRETRTANEISKDQAWPYLQADGCKWSKDKALFGRRGVEYVWTNHGATPAKSVVVVSLFSASPYPLPKVIIYVDNAGADRHKSIPNGRGARTIVALKTLPTDKNVADILAGGHALVVKTMISYSSIWGGERHEEAEWYTFGAAYTAGIFYTLSEMTPRRSDA